MNTVEIKELLHTSNMSEVFTQLYGEDKVEFNRNRYENLIQAFQRRFGESEFELFSAPGRTEIGGNHTDHNHGQVLAGSINLDCVGVAAKTEGNIINIVSEPYNEDFSINIDDVTVDKNNRVKALVQGIVAGFKEKGYKVGGMNIYATSNVIAAAGVSSSASFEMLICAIIDSFYNDGTVSMIEYAKIGKYAENEYWFKQSGLLDQMACAVGGLIHIDFKEDDNIKVNKMDFEWDKEKYNIIIVNTGKSHADLSDEYSNIPVEMKKVAEFFGKEVCAQITKEDVLKHIKELREKVGDRAILRALHFFNENERVEKQIKALQEGEFNNFLKLVSESGDSSWKVLQNCYAINNYNEQGIPLALTLTELFIREKGEGVCRVHGGGFAGVIMTLIHDKYVDEYMEYMENALGNGCTYKMRIRPWGAVNITKLSNNQ